MKKLQNNFTTPEQSKRLLGLGFPADSADCYINGWCNNRAFQLPKLYSKCDWVDGRSSLPCWSVGRLMEIYDICVNLMPGMQLEFSKEPGNCTYIELIIASFELAADDGLIYFSNLEE